MASQPYHSALIPPAGIWWVPAHKQERRWVAVAFVWCMILFAMMPLWHFRGGQNPTGIRHKVEPMAFYERTQRFITDYQVDTIDGVPVVAPPPGAEVYLLAQMWRWQPILRLEAGASYTIHLSALDVNHGFSLYPQNINIQVVPGYDYGLKMTPNQAGDYRIVCNEFCGIGHHLMVGKIEVMPPQQTAAAAKGEAL